nr:hypothetical protein [Bacillus velezensis]MDH3139010.1 hypothetical protein [Bacillus velezensis]
MGTNKTLGSSAAAGLDTDPAGERLKVKTHRVYEVIRTAPTTPRHEISTFHRSCGQLDSGADQAPAFLCPGQDGPPW